MTFKLDHWKNPRRTIATRFEHNDIAYATHGAMLAMEALRFIDKPASELKKLKLLDYGCGTGRVARVLSGVFGEVYAYDPVLECINTAKSECMGMNFHNVKYFTDITKIPKVDMAVSMNVIEHLSDQDAQVMINNLIEKVEGPSYIWYSSSKNKEIISKYLTEEQVSHDTATSGGGICIREFLFNG